MQNHTGREMATKKKAATATTRKGEPLSIRIDPKVRYGLELLARSQRRSVTGVVEWSIAEAFRNQKTTRMAWENGGWHEMTTSFDVLLSHVWSVNEVDRLIKLAFVSSDLLTFEEDRMSRVLLNTPELWRDWGEGLNPSKFKMFHALKHWDKLRPILVRAADRSTVVGLTDEELTDAGLGELVIPF